MLEYRQPPPPRLGVRYSDGRVGTNLPVVNVPEQRIVFDGTAVATVAERTRHAALARAPPVPQRRADGRRSAVRVLREEAHQRASGRVKVPEDWRVHLHLEATES